MKFILKILIRFKYTQTNTSCEWHALGMLLGRPPPPVWDSEYGTRQAANSYKDSSIIQSCLFLSSHTLDISSYNYLAKLSKGREEGQWEKLVVREGQTAPSWSLLSQHSSCSTNMFSRVCALIG